METKKKSKLIGISVIGGVFLLCAIIALSLVLGMNGGGANAAGSGVDYSKTDTGVSYYGSLTDLAENYTNRFVMTRMKSLGGSHYAYTEGVSDEFPEHEHNSDGNESNYFPGSQLVMLEINSEGGTEETVLIDSPSGVVRDPDVSLDGTKIVFSYKSDRNDDDFHLYVLDLAKYDEGGYSQTNIWECITQLTYGQGVADIEPQWLANGKILFSSSRAVQRVDCWHTVVSNLFTCNADGSNIIRLGYDQVHTTYPTVTSDGRVLYTRWDYNDRNQMYVQGVFQMFADGTNQTELYGNNTNNVTTLLHTREIPGNSEKYISIASGHHVYQGGKLCFVDLAKGENGKQSIEYIFEKPNNENGENIDTFAQEGVIYKYPYAINDKEFFVARASAGWSGDKSSTAFDMLYCVINDDGTIDIEIIATSKSGLPCGQIVPIVSRDVFDRPSMVNYGTDKGTYYVGNVYEGEAMEGVDAGAAKYLRVVELEYRSYANGANASSGTGTADPFSPVSTANGAWDIKRVLGIVDIEADGSALFQVPSDTPVYFQILDENGFMIQSMRSWSTLMPNETFSCVGCHEPKSTVPPLNGGITDAMKKGVQLLRKDLWMDDENYADYDPYHDSFGFSYTDQIQPMLDESCISCHSNNAKAISATGATGVTGSLDTAGATTVFNWQSEWKYSTLAEANTASPSGWNTVGYADSSWATAKLGMGANTSDWTANSSTNLNTERDFKKLLLRKTFTGSADMTGKTFYLDWQFDENPSVYINGVKVGSATGFVKNKTQLILTVPNGTINTSGNNVIAIEITNVDGGCYIDGALKYVANAQDASKPISFTGDLADALREKLQFSISYLVLTNSTNIDGRQYRGDSTLGTANGTRGYTTWVSAMSQCEILPAYSFGSNDSKLMEVLKDIENHTNGQVSALSFEDMARFAAWIDLGVPYRGRYEEASVDVWSENDYKVAMEGENMRDFYNTQDKMNKRAIAGNADTRDVTVEYTRTQESGGEYFELTSSGYMQLFVTGGYKVGDEITVTLPEGVQYFYLNLNHRMKTSLIYAPDGVYTYRVPEDMRMAYPKSFARYATGQITVYLPTDEELKQEYNLALNPYALGQMDGNGNSMEYAPSFPKVTASSYWGDGVTINGATRNEPDNFFNPECAIDGFYGNPNAHGTYPSQSWGADSDDNLLEYTIEFGRDVCINSIDFRLRADWSGNHDSYFDGAKVILSDGTEFELTLEKLRDWQKIAVPDSAKGVKTTSVKFVFSKAAGPDWAGLAEVNVNGYNA